MSVYKARKVLCLKYSTAKQIVNMYKNTGKIDRTNAIKKIDDKHIIQEEDLKEEVTDAHSKIEIISN